MTTKSHSVVCLFDHDMVFHGAFLVPADLDLQAEYDRLVAGGYIHTVRDFANLLPNSKRYSIFEIKVKPVQVK